MRRANHPNVGEQAEIPDQNPTSWVGRKWAKDMEARSRSQRLVPNCGKLAAILQETGSLTHRSFPQSARLTTCLGVACLGVAGVAVILCAGCGSGLSAIDRRVDRVLAERSAAIGGGAMAPQREWPNDTSGRYRDLAERQPPTVNPRADQLNFQPASETRDFRARLDALQSQTEAADDPSIRKLGLMDSWRQSLLTGREFLAAQEDYILSGIRLLIERHRWSPRLFANSSLNYQSVQEGPPVENTLRLLNEAGVRKRLPFGGEVEAKWMYEASENLRSAASGQYTDSSSLVLSGNIPLLKDAGLVAQESRIQAERDLVYAARNFENFRRQFLVNIARDYFSLLQQKDNIVSTVRQVESLRSILARQENLYEAGRVAKFDVNNAASDVLNAEAGLANAREAYLISLDRFRVRLGITEDTRIAVEPSEFILPEPNISLDDAVTFALGYRLDLQNRRDQLDDSKRSVQVAANALLPDLNATASASFPTSGRDRDFSEAIYNAGLRLDLPVDKEQERLSLRSATIAAEKAQRDFEQFRDELITDVRARVREIERARFALSLAEARVAINERRQEEQIIKADEVDAQQQLDTENALLDSRRALNQAKADVRNSVLDYLVATGTMRVKADGTFEPLPGMETAPTPDLPPDAPVIPPEPEPAPLPTP